MTAGEGICVKSKIVSIPSMDADDEMILILMTVVNLFDDILVVV